MYELKTSYRHTHDTMENAWTILIHSLRYIKDLNRSLHSLVRYFDESQLEKKLFVLTFHKIISIS